MRVADVTARWNWSNRDSPGPRTWSPTRLDGLYRFRRADGRDRSWWFQRPPQQHRTHAAEQRRGQGRAHHAPDRDRVLQQILAPVALPRATDRLRGDVVPRTAARRHRPPGIVGSSDKRVAVDTSGWTVTIV
jgi:hypothetical protein